MPQFVRKCSQCGEWRSTESLEDGVCWCCRCKTPPLVVEQLSTRERKIVDHCVKYYDECNHWVSEYNSSHGGSFTKTYRSLERKGWLCMYNDDRGRYRSFCLTEEAEDVLGLS